MRVATYNTYRDENNLCQLVKENSTNVPLQDINSPQKVVQLLCTLFHANKLTEEYTWLIAVNAKMKVIGVFEISHGNIACSIISPREIFMRLCACNAYGFMVAHNHVSGVPVPSKEDVNVTKRLSEAARIMEFQFTDHVVIGTLNDYYSFKEAGLL